MCMKAQQNIKSPMKKTLNILVFDILGFSHLYVYTYGDTYLSKGTYNYKYNKLYKIHI